MPDIRLESHKIHMIYRLPAAPDMTSHATLLARSNVAMGAAGLLFDFGTGAKSEECSMNHIQYGNAHIVTHMDQLK